MNNKDGDLNPEDMFPRALGCKSGSDIKEDDITKVRVHYI